jgi:hypothetical protein
MLEQLTALSMYSEYRELQQGRNLERIFLFSKFLNVSFHFGSKVNNEIDRRE